MLWLYAAVVMCAAVMHELLEHYHLRCSRFKELATMVVFRSKTLNTNDMAHLTDRIIFSYAMEMVRTVVACRSQMACS